MGRVPRKHITGIVQTCAVMMTDDGRPFAIAGPVAARRVAAGCRKMSSRVRTRQDVMLVRLASPSLDRIAVFIESGLSVDIHAVAMQVVYVLRNQDSFCVMPRAGPDPVPRADTVRDLGAIATAVDHHTRAQIRGPAPCRASGLRKLPAMSVSPLQTAEIGAVACTVAGDEERHSLSTARGLSATADGAAHCHQRECSQKCRAIQQPVHVDLPLERLIDKTLRKFLEYVQTAAVK